MHKEIISCPHFSLNTQHHAAKPTRRAVSISLPVPCVFRKVAYFLAKCLKALRAGRQASKWKREKVFFSFRFELAQPAIGAEINIWATFPLGLQRLLFNLCFGSPLTMKENLSNWINIFDRDRLSSTTSSQTIGLLLKESFLEHW